MARGFRVRLDRGINLSDPPSELEPGELVVARNCHYLPESGRLAKINGRTVFGAMGAAPVQGLSFVKFRTAGSFLVGAAGTSFYTVPVGTTGTWTARATGLSSVGKMEAVYFNGSDRAYLVDGVNGMRVWTGSGNMRAAGLTRPAKATLTFLNNAATSYPNISTFYYTHTELDSVNDVESAPADPVQTSATAANGTFKYAFPTKTNSAADKYRVYRTQSGGSIFYLIAEIASTNLRYYDGDDTELLGSSVDNDTVWGFKTVEDLFLSTRPVLPMVGEPLRSNYITQNGTIPIGDIVGVFQNFLYITGIPSFPQDVYYSMSDFPEMFSPVYYLRQENERGDPVTGAGVANDRFIAFTLNSIYRHNTFPQVTDPGFGIGITNRELVTSDHGCVAKRTVVNFGIGQPNNRLFYLSTRGPMMTDGYNTWPLNEDLDWSERVVNLQVVSGAIARNFPKYGQIWLFVPSAGSTVNDMAFIYHYHPNHMKKDFVGNWTGPIHVRCAAATVSYDRDTETRLYTGDTNTSGNVYLEDNGLTDAQNYDDPAGKIDWEWMTGDQPFDEESANKRAHRVFLNTVGTDSFDATLRYAVNKRDAEHIVPLSNISTNTAGTLKMGTTDASAIRTRTYRGGIWQTGSHFRWHMQEKAAAAREIASIELEVEGFGRQK